jgi:hypothetical protein
MQRQSYHYGTRGGKEKMTIMMDTGNRIAAKAAIMAHPEVVAAYQSRHNNIG